MKMNKEEILERSRKENKNGDEHDDFVLGQAGKISSAVGILTCMLISLTSYLIAGRSDSGCWTVMCAIYASAQFVSFRKTKRKSSLILAIIFLLSTIFFAVIYVIALRKGLC